MWILLNFNNIYFEELLRKTVFVISHEVFLLEEMNPFFQATLQWYKKIQRSHRGIITVVNTLRSNANKSLTWDFLFFWGWWRMSPPLACIYLLVQSQQCKHQNNLWNLFNLAKRHHNGIIVIVLVSLLLTLDRFQILFWCFHCCFWANKYRLVRSLSFLS